MNMWKSNHFELCPKLTESNNTFLFEQMAGAAGPSTETVAVEEDAADLQFPKEFELADTKTLLISEVNILLEHRKQQVRDVKDQNFLSKSPIHYL